MDLHKEFREFSGMNFLFVDERFWIMIQLSDTYHLGLVFGHDPYLLYFSSF